MDYLLAIVGLITMIVILTALAMGYYFFAMDGLDALDKKMAQRKKTAPEDDVR